MEERDGENNQAAPKQHRRIGILPIILILFLVGVVVVITMQFIAQVCRIVIPTWALQTCVILKDILKKGHVRITGNNSDRKTRPYPS